GDLVVLCIGVVVAALRAPQLVSVREHRHALRERERRQEGAHHPPPHAKDARVVGLTFRIPVAAHVVVVAVTILLAVIPVVLLLIARQVPQREAVVRSDEVHARVHGTIAPAVYVARARQARRQIRDVTRIAAPEVPHGVPILTVPLRPPDREVPQL